MCAVHAGGRGSSSGMALLHCQVGFLVWHVIGEPSVRCRSWVPLERCDCCAPPTERHRGVIHRGYWGQALPGCLFPRGASRSWSRVAEQDSRKLHNLEPCADICVIPLRQNLADCNLHLSPASGIIWGYKYSPCYSEGIHTHFILIYCCIFVLNTAVFGAAVISGSFS